MKITTCLLFDLILNLFHQNRAPSMPYLHNSWTEGFKGNHRSFVAWHLPTPCKYIK